MNKPAAPPDPVQHKYDLLQIKIVRLKTCNMRKTGNGSGATRGIGKACALRLTQDGFDITATCRSNPERFEDLEKEARAAGRDFHALAFDIADRQAAADALCGYFGDDAPDVLVYNAGIKDDEIFAFMSPEQWDRVLHTNTDGFFNCVQVLIGNMIARKNGRIIVISSISGQTGQAGQVNYSASKAALLGAVKALAKEVARKKILVNAVTPGFIATDMTEGLAQDELRSLIPMRRIGTTEEVAGVVSFLAGKDSSYITGQVIAVNGGLFIG